MRDEDESTSAPRLTSGVRIVHYIDHVDFRRGGPARAVVDQVRVMRQRGHDATIASMTLADVPDEWKQAPEHGGAARAIEVANRGGRIISAVGIRSLDHAVTTADIVHLHGVWEPSNLQVAALARKRGVATVVSLRGMLDDWCMAQGRLKKRIYLALGGRKMLERAAVVHCTAQAELEQSSPWFPRGRGMVVPNLMDLAPFRSMPGPAEAVARFKMDPASLPVVLFLSRMSHKKGVEHLIEAVSMLARRGVAVRLIIAGDGDEEYARRMRRLAASVGASARIDFVGHVGGSLKLSLLQASTLFALPTSQENFGFVFFEALAAGLPVLTTNLVDTKDEIAASGAGEIVPQNAEAFATAMERLLADRAALAQRGKVGRQWAMRELDTDAVAARFEALYQVALCRAAKG